MIHAGQWPNTAEAKADFAEAREWFAKNPAQTMTPEQIEIADRYDRITTVVFEEAGERFENIFLAAGFSEEEAAELMAESEARIAFKQRRRKLFQAVAGKRKKAGNRRFFPTLP